ncbi:hypothetical protein [Neobacillus mesonae]|nr:hypothetical protein [Neobacillus mesonae]MCM3571117.1 hypothetical protein [Neobacillus mesonae]
MVERYNTGDEATNELKKTLANTKPRQNPNMSDAEVKLKFQRKKDN